MPVPSKEEQYRRPFGVHVKQVKTTVFLTEAQQTAVRSLEKALTLLRSVETLEGTDKDSVDYLLEGTRAFASNELCD